jgi:hypothetical protein
LEGRIPEKQPEGEVTPERRLEQELAVMALDTAKRQLEIAPRRLAWLLASPAVLGGLLLIFVVIAWGVLEYLEPSGTTSTSLVVGALLVLVPAALATLRGTSAPEHAQQVFEQVESLIKPESARDEDERLGG